MQCRNSGCSRVPLLSDPVLECLALNVSCQPSSDKCEPTGLPLQEIKVSALLVTSLIAQQGAGISILLCNYTDCKHAHNVSGETPKSFQFIDS